eukprot:1146344-Pelagomonas_calceolata.AAC.2
MSKSEQLSVWEEWAPIHGLLNGLHHDPWYEKREETDPGALANRGALLTPQDTVSTHLERGLWLLPPPTLASW